MRRSISSYLQAASEAGNEKDAMNYLRGCDLGPAPLKKIFDLTFKHNWLLPEGTPPYKPCEFDQEGALYGELRIMYLFLEGGNPNMTALQRERKFVELLEYVDPEDAKLLCSIKDGKIPYKNINQRMANKLFPGEYPTSEQKEKEELTDD
jgi:hypothetical protein